MMEEKMTDFDTRYETNMNIYLMDSDDDSPGYDAKMWRMISDVAEYGWTVREAIENAFPDAEEEVVDQLIRWVGVWCTDPDRTRLLTYKEMDTEFYNDIAETLDQLNDLTGGLVKQAVEELGKMPDAHLTFIRRVWKDTGVLGNEFLLERMIRTGRELK
jgi:hypothetical protein